MSKRRNETCAGGAPAFRSPPRRAFTLLEVLTVVSVIAIVAAIAIPMVSNDSGLRLTAVASVLRSDIELAQVMSIAHPEDPIAVKFADDMQSYWLAAASTPDTPILRADTGEPYVVVLGAGRAVGAQGVAIELVNVTGNVLSFNSTGGLSDFSVTPTIKIAHDESGMALTIAPTTGSVTEAEYDPTP